MTNHSPFPPALISSKEEGFLVLRENGMVESFNEKAKLLFQISSAEVCVEDLFLHFSVEELIHCEKGVLLQYYAKPMTGNPFPVFLVVHYWMGGNSPNYFITIHNLSERSLLDSESYEPLKELVDIKYALDESSIVAVTDQRGRIRYVNKKFCEVSKYEVEELIGNDHRLLNSGHHSKEFFKNLWRTIGAGHVWKGEIKNKAKDGSFYWVDTTIVPFLNDKGKPYQYLAIRNEITERKRVQQELQHMMTRLIHVQEEERKQVSRELHDGIGQELYSLLISMHRVQQEVDHSLLDQMTDEIRDLIQNVRDMSWELRPSALDELGLMPAVRSFLNRLNHSYGLKVHFTSSVSCRLSPQIETTIYRIIQEALTNIRKYACVDEASIVLKEADGGIFASITDQGKGFMNNRAQKGVGLFSMEERARAAGGELEITSERNKGTRIELYIPLET
ncbi:PAS domain S-box-containing protein [Halobacillus alkaliphilus]|uniref:histidine kinase n=1 Tax=Halobacillus alkaliphilus TaxID=396056 RepID=A0A1I2QWC2_9BACI|nr:PAS domain-containing sensor histidine kinase [Halobacillus alkaliphilus]SFG32692.1 PAS domain S-box-containing protein [Halobacillus alkaliphilus]